jgi:deoxyribodipyrimidine photo-lyase
MPSIDSTRTQVVWFKRDLRLADHAPLDAAVRSFSPVLPLFIIEPDYWRLPDVSSRHWHFIHDSLAGLRDELAACGSHLLVRTGSAVSVLSELRQVLGGFDLHSHEETGSAWTYRRDVEVGQWCRAQGVDWHEYPSHGVVRRLKTRDTWSRLRDVRMATPQIAAPRRVHSPPGLSAGDIPAKDHSMFGALDIGKVQQGGRLEGIEVLGSFLADRSRKCMQTISKPGISARHCSRLSAHIAYGTLSVKEVDQAAKSKMASIFGISGAEAASHRLNLSAFRSRLAWRCHFVQKLEQQPEIETRCMHPAFEGMREPHHSEALFEAWKQGRTGYPLVDASMRSLHENGWINFRMRAMLVSFASYHLWLDWRVTAPFLARLFTDYEPGIHYSQFQMQSGVTGINAIRMYAPVKQSRDHDPEGKFIRRHVPELQHVSPQWIHEPWRMSEPPADYPLPVVDQETAMKHARSEIAKRWKSDAFRDTAKDVAQKLGSRAKQPSRKPRKPPSRQLELEL